MNADPHNYHSRASSDSPGVSGPDDSAAPEIQQEFIVLPGPARERWWKRIGGGSLTVSLLLHGAFIALAVFVLRFVVESGQAREAVPFVPGSSGGGSSADVKAAAQLRQASMQRPGSIVATPAVNAAVSLPDVQGMSGFLTAASFSTTRGGGGTGGGEGGLRGPGRGGSGGPGMSGSFGPGTEAGFVSMFGKSLKAQRLAVVLDVSASMHQWLPTVVREANKISGGCPVVLFFGCGLTVPDDAAMERQTPSPARGREFEEFWRRTFTREGMPDSGALPNEEVFQVFDDRKDTFFYERLRVGYSWLALTSQKVREADAIYWFADFQDPVDETQLQEVQKMLLRRKQKLYVHASGSSNPSLAAVERMLVRPTGGEVLRVDLKAGR